MFCVTDILYFRFFLRHTLFSGAPFRGCDGGAAMRFGVSVGFVALLGLIGCVETNGAGTTTMLPPPEYLKCSSVPQELAVADLNTKKLGV